MNAYDDRRDAGRVLVFVYGTLKRGRCNHALVAGQEFIAEARTQPVYRMFDLGGYPGIFHASPGISITGELWRVDAECLARLDALEGLDEGEYTREKIEIAAPHEIHEALGYLYAKPVKGFGQVMSGVW